MTITATAASNGASTRQPPGPAAPEEYGTPLDDVRAFLAQAVYASDEVLDALTLVMTVTHATDAFTTLPRVLVTSDQSQSGKSTVLDTAEMLCDNPWLADPTGPALKAKYIEPQPDGLPITLILDEISKVFGESGLNGRQSPIYRVLCDGYRKSGTFNHSVAKVAMDVPCFSVAFMGGLRTAAPEDLRSRSIRILMKKKPPLLQLEDTQDPDTQAIGKATAATLHAWARLNAEEFRNTARNGLHRVHPKLTDRRRQIWGPLFAVALTAGGDWPDRCMSAFASLALDSDDRPVLTPQQQITLDTADLIMSEHLTVLFTADAVDCLRGMEDRPLYEALSDRRMAKLLAEALGPSETIRGTSRAGKEVVMKGRHCLPVLRYADSLRARFMPPIRQPEPDEWDAEFEDLSDEAETDAHV